MCMEENNFNEPFVEVHRVNAVGIGVNTAHQMYEDIRSIKMFHLKKVVEEFQLNEDEYDRVEIVEDAEELKYQILLDGKMVRQFRIKIRNQR